MTNAKVLLIALSLVISACASRPVAPAEASLTQNTNVADTGTAGEVAKGAGKGALGGAYVCSIPVRAGLYLGPIGFAIGGLATLYCLPFGVTLGAVAGAARSGS